MKKLFGFMALLFITSVVFAQKPYNPSADADADIKKAVESAKKENKHVLLMIGGNWCPWCIMLDKYMKSTESVKNELKKSYVLVKVNYSKKDKKPDLMKRLQYPNRFGFPVLVVLNEKGERIHTQNSAYLEEGRGYNEKTVLSFLKAWNRAAIDPANYKKLLK